MDDKYSIFVRDLEARTTCLSVTGSDTLRDVKASLEEATGIPLSEQYITSRHILDDATCLEGQGIVADSTLHLSARLRGGKGGFGSLLRGSGKAAQTENEDACRDLSGRRLRLVNADKKLKDWAALEKQRREEKQAAKEERDKAKAEVRAEEAQVNLDAIRKDQSIVLTSVAKALESSRKNAQKRPLEANLPAKPAVKKSRYSSQSEDESDSEGDVASDEDVNEEQKPALDTESGGTKEIAVAVASNQAGTTAAAVQIPLAT